MFIDANVFVSAWLGKDQRARRCQDFIEKVERGEQRASTSVLVFDEVLHSLETNTGDREKSLAIVKRLAAIQYLKIYEVTPKQLAASFRVFSSYGLRPRDSLHVATMLENGVEKILSYDRDFDTVKEIKRVEP